MLYSLREQLSFEIDEANLPIRSEQIRARLRSYPRMVAARSAVTLMVLGLMWGKVAVPVLLGWAGMLFLMYAIESLYVWRYWDAMRTVAECRIWHSRLMLFVSLVGGLWGAGGLLLFVPDNLAYQAILICAMLGMAAGAVTTNPVFPPALYIFVPLLILPILLANALVGDSEHLLLSGLLMLFLVYVMITGKELAQTFELSLRQMLENKQLAQGLILENQRAELAQQQAEQASISKSRFLAAASHDLRQPMHALTMFVGALKAHVHGEQGTRLMAQVETSVDVLGEMFDSLLDISRLDTGAVSPYYQTFPVQQIFDRMEGEFSRIAQEKGLALNMEECADTVHSDSLLLERILRNLLANAIRYTERGWVSVRCERVAENLKIEVRDSGLGISGEHLPHIFDEYYQIGNKQRDRNNGLGLGLAIVQRLARLLGAEVRVSSSEGVGSCFSLLLPLELSDVMIQAVSKV
ncbi:MAG: HAMP domain-containing histidine kinase [Gallionella sp.]|nr:HAMP domain-containing histidine kinase [Gallionella sp.]